ncbi:MAG: MFS transporter [Deltaproteobacteria bacterium]|nr:MFS transporter [Deltaproteobacteria bacterium]
MGEARIIPYALMMTGSGFLVLIFLNGETLLLISGLMSGCGHGFLFPCLNAMALRGEPMGIRGKINGIFTGGIDAGVFSGSIVLGYVGEWGGFQGIFFLTAAALFTGVLFYHLKPVRQSLRMLKN